MRDEAASKLHLAIQARDVAAVRACLDAGTSANAKDYVGVSALARAAQRGNADVVALLLERGASVNKKENDGGLALHGSLRHSPDSRILDMLLERGLSPRLRVSGHTAIAAAARNDALGFVQKLITLGVDPHAIDEDGRSALDEAVSSKSRKVEKHLRALGVTEHHASRRALVKALLGAFGGKATEVSGGVWLVNPKRLGPRMQITVSADSHVIKYLELRFRARALTWRGVEVLRVRHRDVSKPPLSPRELTDAGGLPAEVPEQRELPLAFRDAPLRATHRADLAAAAVDEILAGCRVAEPLLAALELVPGDELLFGFEGMMLHCAGHDPARAVRRAAVLLELKTLLAPELPPSKPVIDGALTLTIGRGVVPNEPASGLAHRWGGAPIALMACPECGVPCGSVLTLDLRDARLAGVLPGRERLEILLCPECFEWGPCFTDHSDAEPRRIRSEPAEEEHLDEPPELALARRELRLDVAKSATGAKSRLGGSPSWLQGDNTPDCPRCSQSMAFVMQVMSRPDISFGDEGRLYVFTCAGCLVSATLIQSH